MKTKTKQGWDESKRTLDTYLAVGDIVDDEIYDYFLGVLPPACNSAKCLQIGEPSCHDDQGRPCFATLEFLFGRWVYMGDKATPEGETSLYID